MDHEREVAQASPQGGVVHLGRTTHLLVYTDWYSFGAVLISLVGGAVLVESDERLERCQPRSWPPPRPLG